MSFYYNCTLSFNWHLIIINSWNSKTSLYSLVTFFRMGNIEWLWYSSSGFYSVARLGAPCNAHNRGDDDASWALISVEARLGVRTSSKTSTVRKKFACLYIYGCRSFNESSDWFVAWIWTQVRMANVNGRQIMEFQPSEGDIVTVVSSPSIPLFSSSRHQVESHLVCFQLWSPWQRALPIHNKYIGRGFEWQNRNAGQFVKDGSSLSVWRLRGK